MFNIAKNIIRYNISVYDGISPALLATISLGQNIKGKNHLQLINSLKTSNIIQSQTLLSTFKQLDRSIFTNEKKVYENKPYKISKGQCMTDIFSHAPYLKIKQRYSVLDIGTGHGYLSFALWLLSEKLGKKGSFIHGIDCYEECISKCEEIKMELGIKNDLLKFQKQDINQIIKRGSKYDVIIGGFFIEPNLSTKLQQLLENDGVGIWPQVSESGQGLYLTKKGKPKQYIMQTLFSQQVVQSSVQQYFISDHAQSGSQNQQQVQQQKDEAAKIEQQKLKVQRLRNEIKQKKNSLQQKLKVLIDKHKRLLNLKSMTLKQMQSIDQINQVLEELKKYK